MNGRSRSSVALTSALSRFLARLSLWIALWSATLVVISVISASAEGRPTGLPIRHPRVPQTMIACLDRKTGGFTGKVEPWHCEVAGIVEFAGRFEGKSTKNTAHGQFARFPIRGVWERIEWGDEWGTFKAYGSEAVNARSGKPVQLVAYRRVRCADGSTWYSRANVF